MRMFTEEETKTCTWRVVPWLVGAVVRDTGLSVKARLLGAHLALCTRGRGATDQELIAAVGPETGLPEEEAARLFAELDAQGYIGRYDEDCAYMRSIPGLRLPGVRCDYHEVLALADVSVLSSPERMFPGAFEETVRALSFPPNLQSHYYEICGAMKRHVFGFVVPENVERIQKVLDEVSESMKAGKVDARGPVGIIVTSLRGQANVSRRDFGPEGEEEDEGGQGGQ